MQIPIKNLCHVIAHISSTTYMAISSKFSIFSADVAKDDDFALMEFILKKQGNLIQIVLIKTFIY